MFCLAPGELPSRLPDSSNGRADRPGQASFYSWVVLKSLILRIGDFYSHLFLFSIIVHPPPDTPQKKNQKTHLRDPQNYQVDGIDIPKQKVAKFSQSRFFNKINSKTL